MFWIAEVKDLYDDSILYWIVQYWQGYSFEKMKLSSTKKKIFALHKRLNFSVKDFFSKCDQICKKWWIWSHLLKKSLMENFIFCAVLRFQLKCKIEKEQWTLPS